MVALMNMATLHMHHGGAPLPIIGVVLSMHTMAMFVPGTLVGYLADRYGAARVLVAGLLLQLLAAAVLYVAGPHDTGLVSLGLVLLGAGWSAGFIAGSALLVAATEEPQRLQAQGAADFLLQLTAACGALAAGTVVARLGYPGLAGLAGCALLAALCAMFSGAASGAAPGTPGRLETR